MRPIEFLGDATVLPAVEPPPFRGEMQDFLPLLVERLQIERDTQHRFLMVAHLFDDTMRMLAALEKVTDWDAIIGISYSSNRDGLAARWRARFGDRVHVAADLDDLERIVVDQLARTLAKCRAKGQKLIVQEVGGFVVPLLHKYFADQLWLVRGVVELTKQGVWRAEALPLAIPVVQCADSELKRLEAARCGETIARCLDGVARDLGLSLAGRRACVIGAGWIGSGVARALRRLDMIPQLVDRDPLKVVEARLEGFAASTSLERLEECQLVVGATGAPSITAEVIERLPNYALIASGSSRQFEIDVRYLNSHPSRRLGAAVRAYALGETGRRQILLVNDGYPANFVPGSASVADEIVELILGEIIVLLQTLMRSELAPGIHRMSPEQERTCAELWLELRDTATRGRVDARPVIPARTLRVVPVEVV
jgi:adenosylhomocysteinase